MFRSSCGGLTTEDTWEATENSTAGVVDFGGINIGELESAERARDQMFAWDDEDEDDDDDLFEDDEDEIDDEDDDFFEDEEEDFDDDENEEEEVLKESS